MYIGSFIGTALSGLGKIYLLIKAIGLATLAWSTFLGPAVLKIITANDKLYELSRPFFRMLAGSTLINESLDFMKDQIFAIVRIKGPFMDGLKKSGELLKKGFVKNRRLAMEKSTRSI